MACLVRLYALKQAADPLYATLPDYKPFAVAFEEARGTGIPQQIWGLTWLRYACLCPVIDGWRVLARAEPQTYADRDIERLLNSPLRFTLYGFRDSVLHFTGVNDPRVMAMMEARDAFIPWAEELQDRFLALHSSTRPQSPQAV